MQRVFFVPYLSCWGKSVTFVSNFNHAAEVTTQRTANRHSSAPFGMSVDRTPRRFFELCPHWSSTPRGVVTRPFGRFTPRRIQHQRLAPRETRHHLFPGWFSPKRETPRGQQQRNECPHWRKRHRFYRRCALHRKKHPCCPHRYRIIRASHKHRVVESHRPSL